MISEVLNALFITYVATEYHLSAAASSKFEPSSKTLLRPHVLGGLLVVILINIFDRVSGATHFANSLVLGFLHAPKIVLVIFAYTIGLYFDCRRIQPNLRSCAFFRILGVLFLQILPLYPVLAICISFGFLLLINLFQFLHLPLELLNMPIYYGTLYGPFSLVYFRVKRRILQERSSLPTSTALKR